jgi:HEAT repeat protein
MLLTRESVVPGGWRSRPRTGATRSLSAFLPAWLLMLIACGTYDPSERVARDVKMLKEGLALQKAEAAINVGGLGEAAVPAVPALIATLGDTTPLEWVHRQLGLEISRAGKTTPGQEAADALVRIGAPAIPLLIDAMRGGVPAGSPVPDVLAKMGQPAVAPLIAALSHEDWGVREAAAAGLGSMKEPHAVDHLIAMLTDDKAPRCRYAAARALGQIRDPRAVEPLTAALNGRDRFLRGDAARALGEYQDPRLVPVLVAALGREPDKGAWKEQGSVTTGAEQALARIGSPAVASLIAALKDKDPEIRVRAAAVLAALKSPSGVEPLVAALKDPDPYVRGHVAWTLGTVEDPRVVEPLIAALDDDRIAWKGNVAFALGRRKDPRAVEPLIAALRRPGERVLKQEETNALVWITSVADDERRSLGQDPDKWQAWWTANRQRFPQPAVTGGGR